MQATRTDNQLVVPYGGHSAAIQWAGACRTADAGRSALRETAANESILIRSSVGEGVHGH